MNKLILTLNIVVFSITIFSQTTNSSENKTEHYIEVEGTAKLYVIPDEIFISIELKERQEGKDNISIEFQENQLKKGLQEINIDIANLELSDANAFYSKLRWTTKEVVGSTKYILKVKNAEEVGKVFKKLDELKIQDAEISSVSHSKIEEYRKEVKIKAIIAAKEKADYLLEAIGETAGKPIIIKEIDNDRNYAYISNTISQANVYKYKLEDSDKYDQNEIEFKKLILISKIYMKIEIK